MATDIRVPTLGESVTEATIGQWFKKVGDRVAVDEPLVELETDKVTLEVPAPAAGVIEAIDVKDGDTVEVGALLGRIGEGDGAPTEEKPAAKEAEEKPASNESEDEPTATEAAEEPAAKKERQAADTAKKPSGNGEAGLAPSVARLVEEHDLDVSGMTGSGKGGRLTKGDVMSAIEALERSPADAPSAEVEAAPTPGEDAEREERVKMTRLRQTIARRLKEAQNTAAMLTTFNEVDMSAVMALRQRYKELFEQKHGIKLGFMGLFAKAAIHTLKEIPAVNAEVEGDEIVYKNFYHIGIAVGTDKGLVVPVVRDADRKSLAEIESDIADLGRRARDGELTIQEMQGGTFTISNGGVYGSLMSTPILNAPQSGILGMHKIQDRPVVVDGKVEVRPMMYLALTYDHRIVDGREAVTFLVRIKDVIEAPERLVFDL